MQTVFEKIIEKLENYSDADEAEQYGTIPVIELDRAIEIVKQGCVADDVCEWKSMIFELKKAEKTSSK